MGSLGPANGASTGVTEMQMSLEDAPRSTWLNRAVFLGTGTSSQVPEVGCLLAEEENDAQGFHCKACHDAVRPDSKNLRGCTSVILAGGGKRQLGAHNSSSGSATRSETYEDESTILIDCGPTFYASAVKNFKRHRLRAIDAVLLTHAHADAILGLDNLRAWTMRGTIQQTVDIYCTEECFKTVQSAFPYLVDSKQATGSGLVVDLRFKVISPDKPFDVSLRNGEFVQVTPLPVYHGFARGEPFQALGFRIDSMSYISDCHHVPASTAQLVSGSDFVTIDALNPYKHRSHFSLAQALSYIISLPGVPPRLAALTDLAHNLEHDETEQAVQAWREKLVEWIAVERKRCIDTCADLTDAKASPDSRHIGEGSGPRWWAHKWDESAAEGRAEVGSRLLDSSLRSADLIGALKPHEVALLPSMLPQIRLAWDGVEVKFARRSA